MPPWISGRGGVSFDRRYTNLEVADHQQDIEETTGEIGRGWNASMRQLGRLDLPLLKTHLMLSERARSASR